MIKMQMMALGIINEASSVVNYAPRVMTQIVASLTIVKCLQCRSLITRHDFQEIGNLCCSAEGLFCLIVVHMGAFILC